MRTIRNDVDVVTLVARAMNGDQLAWQHIVLRFEPLVQSICRRFGLAGTDTDDVSGSVWFRLVTHLTDIREPAALPGWLKTTAQRECLTLLRTRVREIPIEDLEVTAPGETAPYSRLLVEERRAALRKAFARLSSRDQKLLAMLFAAPPRSYERISAVLGMPIGAIGPTRQRCLARLRSSPELAAWRTNALPSRAA
jgi:RNA polymerase sigma factor (sigma-70 family)